MYRFSVQKRIRYSETDKMGYLYYGNYPALYEIGRVEMLRSLGLSYQQFEDKHGIILPVIDLHIRYLKPAYYDEEIKIDTILESMPGKMISFKHELFNEHNELINKAEVKLFFVDQKSNQRISVPPSLKEALKPYFN